MMNVFKYNNIFSKSLPVKSKLHLIKFVVGLPQRIISLWNALK